MKAFRFSTDFPMFSCFSAKRGSFDQRFPEPDLTTKPGSAFRQSGILYLASSALLLLMLGILADDHHTALPLDNLALLADRLHRRTNFHGSLPPYMGSGPPSGNPKG